MKNRFVIASSWEGGERETSGFAESGLKNICDKTVLCLDDGSGHIKLHM